MSSSPPPDRPESATSDDDVDDAYDPDPDDEDTGPLHVSTPSPSFDSDLDSGPAASRDAGPAQGTWAGRFDAPLTVSPRQVQRQRDPKVPLIAVAAVIAVALVGGLVFWLLLSSSDSPDAPNAEPTTTTSAASPNAEDEARLLRLLPPGYPSDSCEAVDPPKDALAQVNCEKNNDPGGPLSATYTLARDKEALDAAFNGTVQAANRVNCPGNIQSPGPWRRNATPDKVSGILFCGLQEGRPTVAWTDDANRVVSVADAGPSGPTLPQLYAWWSSHS